MITRNFFFILWILLSGPVPLFAGNQGPGIEFEGEHPVYLSKYFHNILPGRKVYFKILSSNPDDTGVKASRGTLYHKQGNQWAYTAPVNGNTDKIVIEDRKTGKTIRITVFILTPRTEKKGEYLNGYRIGNYPPPNYKNRPIYSKPAGFIKVNKETEDIYITPHFQLGQFVCKERSSGTKYLLIKPKLLVKLEIILNELNNKGIPVKTLFIMSGYRTPYYNHLIGNVKYSRHIYGDASDIYVDENRDGVMDDLNRDGKSNMNDAMVIYNIISKMDKDPRYAYLVGGLGKYSKTSRHTWFVHVDTRGYPARW